MGTQSNEHLGSCIDVLDDMNDDGYPEIVLCHDGSKIVSGRTFDTIHEFDVGVLHGLGDIDSDGVEDLAVAQPNAAPGGMVSVYSGATLDLMVRFDGEQPNAYFGWQVESVDDLDGDHVGDFLISAPYETVEMVENVGAVYVYSGATRSMICVLQGESANDSFGFSVGDAGDINDDGLADIWVGAHGAQTVLGGESAGYLSVFSGRNQNELFRFDGDVELGFTGADGANIGDVNGDGWTDIAVGSPGTGMNRGQITVFSGFDGSIISNIRGALEPNSHLGMSFENIGDTDNDGFDDIVAGIHDPSNGDNAISVVVFSVSTGLEIRREDGYEAHVEFGFFPLAAPGDINNDGYIDFIIGSPYSDPEGVENAGIAYFLSFSP